MAQAPSGPISLTYVPGSSTKVEQLIGDCDWQVKARNGSCQRTASQTASKYNINGTDIGSSFEHEGKIIFLFGDTISQDETALNYGAGDSLAWSTTSDPEAGLLLNFYTNANNTPLFVRMPGINMGGNNVPNSGISLSDGIYFICNTGADFLAGKQSDRSILVRFDERAQTFTAGRTVSTLPGHFIHTSMQKFGTDVVIFGVGNYRASDIYLSIVPQSSFASGTGARYFAGLVNGQPTWTASDGSAVPVVQDNPLNGPAWPNDTPGVGNLSVVYSEELKLWLMTYDGGRQSPATAGVYFSYAPQPWGPWTAPQLIFNQERDNALGTFIHNPAIQPNPPGDGLNGPTIGGNDPNKTPGGAYAPLLIGRFTRLSGDSLKIHYVLSTWNPYTVVRMRSEFKITPDRSFTVSNLGGASLSSAGAAAAVSSGYARIQPDSGSTTPQGIAIFGYRNGNVLVSEVGVPAVPVRTSGRIYAEVAGAVNAGLAIVNPGPTSATITFQFTDSAGNAAGSGSTTIPAYQQIAQFLDQPPFKQYPGATFQGTFSFTSTAPVAAVALRGFTNERGDFLMSTLPVVDTTTTAAAGTTVVPHFADGDGWTTQLLLVNPSDEQVTGSLQFLTSAGLPATVTVGGRAISSFNYTVPRRSSQKISTSGLAAAVSSGSIRIVASSGALPVPLTVFSYKPGDVTVSEAGAPASSASAFRVYVESSGVAGRSGIDSGIAVANTTGASATVTFEVTDLAGAAVAGVSPVTASLAGFGQTAKFLSDLFPSLPKPFKGLLRISSTAGLSVVGLRTRINERGDFLITTTPPSREAGAATSAELFFPQVTDGGGYTTQFVLFSGTAGQNTSGVLKLLKRDGSPFGIPLN